MYPGSWVKGRGKNAAAGFTLVEMMVVIIVLGVMLSLVIPRLGEIGAANLKRSSRHLTGMIRFLRDESQAKKEVYRLRFDVPNGRYWAEALTITSDQTVEFKRLRSALATEGGLAGRPSAMSSRRDIPTTPISSSRRTAGWRTPQSTSRTERTAISR